MTRRDPEVAGGEALGSRSCFCGGAGYYTDYNCGEAFAVTCTHCRGSGAQCCGCRQPSLRCAPEARHAEA